MQEIRDLEADRLELMTEALPVERLERVWAWGGASSSLGYLYRPSTAEGVAQVFEMARRRGIPVGFKGGGNSYGDAFGNSERIVLDLSRFKRILDWNPESGVIRVEPGVTVEQLWRYALGDGWWPPIVTGTMKTTIGGCAAMNTHGKNAWKLGTFGEHVRSFNLMMPSSEIITCSRSENADIFHAAIGGFGMLGCFTSLTLQLKRVYSGWLNVEAEAVPNLGEALDYFEAHLDDSDYLVGWLDAFARGKRLGRGEMHRATYLAPGEDRYPARSLSVSVQDLPDTLFGMVPKSAMWRFMRPFVNNVGWRMVNAARYRAAAFGGVKQYPQSHAAFHFLLDYVPNWKRAYGRGGLIQYQVFVPHQAARTTFRDIFQFCQWRGLPNYLSVLKRHKPDDFLMSYGLDGYSMAMDFRITERNRGRVRDLTRELDEMVLQAGGRFYFAKDSTLRPEVAAAYLGEETIKEFFRLKQRCDPQHLLQTDLWRRVFPKFL